MQTKRMSLANIKGKLSRTEMKNIMAGSGQVGGCKACIDDSPCGSGHECRQSNSCLSDPKVCCKIWIA